MQISADLGDGRPEVTWRACGIVRGPTIDCAE
jgi:hypothetical protein